jgi:hypothetical protein
VFADGRPDAKEVFSLAAKWWAAADAKDMSDSLETAVKAHAGGLYESISELLDDPLDKALAEKRMRDASDVRVSSDTVPDRKRRLAVAAREFSVVIHVTSDWGTVTLHPASAVEIGQQEVIKGGQQWKISGNKVELSGQPYRRNDSTVRITCRLKGPARDLMLETHKGDIGALYVEAATRGKVIGQFANEGSQGGNAQRSDSCRREFRLVLP